MILELFTFFVSGSYRPYNTEMARDISCSTNR